MTCEQVVSMKNFEPRTEGLTRGGRSISEDEEDTEDRLPRLLDNWEQVTTTARGQSNIITHENRKIWGVSCKTIPRHARVP